MSFLYWQESEKNFASQTLLKFRMLGFMAILTKLPRSYHQNQCAKRKCMLVNWHRDRYILKINRIWAFKVNFTISFLFVFWNELLHPRVKDFITHLTLKASKSQKQNCRAETSSKNERTNLFFYPDGPEILETWNQNLKFQVIPDCQDRKTNSSVRFWKKFFSIILLLRFIDL